MCYLVLTVADEGGAGALLTCDSREGVLQDLKNLATQQ